MTTTGDTPDNQVGVVNAQTPLAEVAGGTAEHTVEPPPNIETLVVVAKLASVHEVPSAFGVTTGARYPVVEIATGELPEEWVACYCEVSSALDAQITIKWPEAPSTKWYIYGDAFGHVAIDPKVASAIGQAGFATPKGIVAVGVHTVGGLFGLNGNEQGTAYVISTIPDTASGDHPPHECLVASNLFSASGELVAAPGAGKRLRIYGWELCSTGSAVIAFLLDNGAPRTFGAVCGLGNVSGQLPAQGWPITTNAAIGLDLFSGTGDVVAIVYYSVETV